MDRKDREGEGEGVQHLLIRTHGGWAVKLYFVVVN